MNFECGSTLYYCYKREREWWYLTHKLYGPRRKKNDRPFSLPLATALSSTRSLYWAVNQLRRRPYTTVHVPIMELLKRFCKHSDVKTPPKSIAFKTQPKRRLSSQPERITSHSYLLALTPIFFFFYASPFYVQTKLLDDPRRERKKIVPDFPGRRSTRV